MENRDINVEKRLKKLSELYTTARTNINPEVFSVDALLDILLVLYDECNTSMLKRDKSVAEFLEVGEYTVQLLFTTIILVKSTCNL